MDQPSQNPSCERGQPSSQPFYGFSDEGSKWTEVTEPPIYIATTTEDFTFAVLSWNIDFMMTLTRERMSAALNHLSTMVASETHPPIILLQEMLESDLELIQAQRWVQTDYFLTDLTSAHWTGYYGTCILIPRSVVVRGVFRVPYEVTQMQRDALFVDLAIDADKSLRVCCTHLESLTADPPRRPAQLAQAAGYMHASDVYASVLGGDLNAIQPFDMALHVVNALHDAYLACGGREDDVQGMTWGQMARTMERERFGLTRMDKLLFCGRVRALNFETFGMDVQVEEERHRMTLVNQGLEKGWVTDHLGVKATFVITDSDF